MMTEPSAPRTLAEATALIQVLWAEVVALRAENAQLRPRRRLIPESFERPKLLVVEGNDPLAIFDRMVTRLGLSDVQVLDHGGIAELPDFLARIQLVSGYSRVASLAVARDAEADPGAAFASVCSALSRAGLPQPARPEQPVGTAPKINVLILPQATAAGSLETLLLQTVAHDPVMPCVEDYLQCISRHLGSPHGTPGQMAKARARVFLASRPAPHLLLGQALDRGYWPWDSPALDHVKQFLTAL